MLIQKGIVVNILEKIICIPLIPWLFIFSFINRGPVNSRDLLFNSGKKINNVVKYAVKLDLEVHAGHGLDYKSTKHLSKINEIVEFNIGHFIVGESVFFGFKNIFLGLVTILILIASIVFCIKEFRKVNIFSSYLMIPYLFWVFFASILNISIFLMN